MAMMNPGRLFLIRLKRNAKEQLRVWGSVMDWTVWVYLLVPALVIGGGLYRELWQELPEWAAYVPWSLLYTLALFILMMGRMRTFIDEADKLFMLQKPSWLQALKRWGILYSVLMLALRLTIPLAGALPFLMLGAGMNWQAIAEGYWFSVAFGAAATMIRHQLDGFAQGWRRWGAKGVMLFALAIIYGWAMLGLEPGTALFLWAWVGIAASLPVIAFAYWRAKLKFDMEAGNERKARMGATEMLMSPIVPPKPLIQLKRPLLFRHSRRLLRGSDAGTMLAEMRLKSFVRSLVPLRVWIGYLSVTVGASLLVPPAGSYAIMIGFIAIGVSWLSTQWGQWSNEEFVAQFRWEGADVRRGIRLSRFWLMLPHLIVWSAIAGYRLNGLWTLGASVIVFGLIWYWLNRSSRIPGVE